MMSGDESEPRRRLRKRLATPPQSAEPAHGEGRPFTSPNKPRNAFDLLKDYSGREREMAARTGKALRKSEFIEGEAEESDDDALAGFGIRKQPEDDEESGGEDQDQLLAELVDDTALDEKALAADAVLEKVREHEEEDDRQLEKLHRDAVEGKLRLRRRDHGVGFEDEDSDEDEDDRIRRQRAMRKKRKLDDDRLEELAKHQDTLPFVQAYHAAIADDDAEFTHLQHDEMPIDQDTDSEREELPQEVVSATELRRQLVEASRSHTIAESFDPHDVSWVEDDADYDETSHIKEISATGRAQSGSKHAVDGDIESNSLGGDDEVLRARMLSWAKSERGSRTAAPTRSTGASAVTGHRKRKGLHNGPASSKITPTLVNEGKNTRKAQSALSVVSSRRNKFDH
ncbi:hypothetical protein CERSUDRAFT_111248 [Gelatoporia subvermispora B]|uniref:DNA replication checkpoint mediator MRC1 domain-containing protein n=1 Tax=Ceriporiopsis subvermispora (strain B) TaxID=914234 RepID=M2RP74_CERS8|nr:hypothetical protein CERSUDRAFT_111248 [Gelatoporia subvermispora B]